MVVNGKEIVYLGYNTPICYDSAKVVDLNGGFVVPLINDLIFYDISHAHCTVLKEGERADFIVLDRDVLKDDEPMILGVYIKGKKKV
jgi:predicted amidohydrolase YtcJ